MKIKLKVSLDKTPLSYVFDERVVTVEKLHAVLIAMMSEWFGAMNKVGVIQQITNNTIEYCSIMTDKEHVSGSMSFSLETITE
jgi:hypothetical protein